MQLTMEQEQEIKLANQILKNSLLARWLDELEQEIYSDWKGSKDQEEREQLHAQFTSLEKLRDIIYGNARAIVKSAEQQWRNGES